MSDNTCKKCGQKGYQGLFTFECLNSSCDAHITAKTVSVAAQPISSGGIPPAPAATPYRTPAASLHNQQLVAMTFLGKMHAGAYGAIGNKLSAASEAKIAGGAPRDWHFGNLARDIDVFCNDFDLRQFMAEFPDATIAPANKQAKNRASSIGGIPASQTHAHISPGYTHGHFEVWDVSWQGESFQIIALSTQSIWGHVLTFDFGLNMITVDRFGTVEESEGFKKDVRDRTLTVYPKTMSFETWKTIPERLKKMLLKFPGYRLEMDT